MAEAVKIKNETAFKLIKLNKDYEICLMIEGEKFNMIYFLKHKDYYLNIENFSSCFLENYKDNMQTDKQASKFFRIQVTIYYENDSIAMYRCSDEHGEKLIQLWKDANKSRKISSIINRIFRL